LALLKSPQPGRGADPSGSGSIIPDIINITNQQFNKNKFA
jgi:hypothetical protein